MSLEKARVLADEMRQYYQARAPWHDAYMGYTDNPSMEALLRPIVDRVGSLLAGQDVLEIACGTGNWTQVLAQRARSVVATDINDEALTLAQAKEYGPGDVAFQAADAYDLGDMNENFTGAFAADWWSHVPHSLLSPFLVGLHDCLAIGARVVFVDMLPGEHPDLLPYRHDSEGNAIYRRTLPDGRSFDVVKNFPDRNAILKVVSKVGREAEYQEWSDLGRWMLTYSVSVPQPK